LYGEKARQLIIELPNRGTLSDATHKASVENPVCGDITHLYLKIEDGVICQCRFQTAGCPAAIAASAAVTILCQEKTAEDAKQITSQLLLDYLGGLPSHKLHGADLAIQALQEALSQCD